MTPRFPDNPLDRFVTDLKARGRLARAPVRHRCKRIAKKIRKREGFLRCPHRTDTPPPEIAKIARATIMITTLIDANADFDEDYSEAEEAEFEAEWTKGT